MSKKHDIDDLFSRMGDEFPEQLPLLSAEERNRIYKMSERKFNKGTDDVSFNEGITVSGVERYSRPVWKRRLASVAAAGVLLAGSGGLVYYVKNGTLDGFNDRVAVDMMSPSTQEDYEKIAAYLLDGYADFCTRIECPESDPNTKVVFSVDGEDVTIARYADTTINSMADFRELGAKYMTDGFLNDNFDLRDAIDKSSFVDGESYSSYDFYAGDANARFFIYNGELYTYYVDYIIDVSKHLTYDKFEITDKSDDSFTIKVDFNSEVMVFDSSADDIVKNTAVMPYVFEAVRSEAGEWRIASRIIDGEKANVKPLEAQFDVLGTAKNISDRYIQLFEYVYSHSLVSDESESVEFKSPDRQRDLKYLRINDDPDETNNVFRNAHSIREIKDKSLMKDELFSSLFAKGFGFADSEMESGDEILYGFDPIIIEYRGALYQRYQWDALIDYDYPAPFTDEPEIISTADDSFVFRRKAGRKANHAEINSIPMTFEFTVEKDENGNWLISDVVQFNDTAENSFSGKDMDAVEKLVLDCNKFGNAICTDTYIDNNDTRGYWLNSEKCAEFHKYVNPDYTSAEQIEEEMNRIFTSELIDSRLFPDKFSCALCTDLDFDSYPDDYIWAVDYAADMMQTPFRYMFVSSKGSIYKNPTKVLSAFPYYPPDAEYETKIAVLDENKVNVSVVYDIPESEYVFNGDTFGNRCTFECIRTSDGWKINNYGTRL